MFCLLFTEEIPQDEDDKETIPAISPVDEQHHNFSYWVKAEDNYYPGQKQGLNKMAASPASSNSKSVRFDDPLRNAHHSRGNRSGVKGSDFDPNDPSCYPLTGSGHEEGDFGVRKGIQCYKTQDGILV